MAEGTGEAGDAVAEPNLLRISRAVSLLPGPESRAWARRELKCDPCEEVSIRMLGTGPWAYMVGDASVLVAASSIETVRLEKREESYIVLASFESAVHEAIAALSTSPLEEAANFLNGELLDVVMLNLGPRMYVIGHFQERARAEEVVAVLKFSTSAAAGTPD